MTNQERVVKGTNLLWAGLAPFVEREAHAAVKAGTVRMDAVSRFAEDPMLGTRPIRTLGCRRSAETDVGDLERRVQGYARLHRAERTRAYPRR